jgi:hypothetical protein
MNEPQEPKSAGTEQKKPIITLLEDIRTRAGFPPRTPRHLINPILVNRIVIGMSLVSLIFFT